MSSANNLTLLILANNVIAKLNKLVCTYTEPYCISYYLAVEISLRGTGDVEATIDKGQTVALGCSMIFTNQVFPPFSYIWRLAGTFNILSRDATYIVTPDSDVSYQCVASARNIKDRTVRGRGIIEITVRGTYLLWRSIVFYVLCILQYKNR